MSDSRLSPGLHQLELPPYGRRCTLYIPDDLEAGHPMPLIVILHYGGPVLPFYGRGLLDDLVRPALRGLNALMAAPDCNAGAWDNEQSEGEILELVDYLFRVYSLDASRTLLTGYSLGGIGTWYLAARHQDLFRAAIPMAATPPPDIHEQSWEIPLYVIHGQLDGLFPLETVQESVSRLRDKGTQIELSIVEGATHYETGHFFRPLRESVPWIQAAWGNAG